MNSPFRLAESSNGLPCLKFKEDEISDDLIEFFAVTFIYPIIAEEVDNEAYQLCKQAQACFRSHPNMAPDQYYVIEFFDPNGAPAFLEYVNAHYQQRTLLTHN